MAMKICEILIYVTTWTNLEDYAMKKLKLQKAIYCTFHLYTTFRIGKFHRGRKYSQVKLLPRAGRNTYNSGDGAIREVI